MKKRNAYINLIFGIFLAAFSFNLFLAPLKFVTGGVSGLALIVKSKISINESLFIAIVNFILLIVSYFFLEKEKTKNTILGSILFPIFIFLTSFISSYIDISGLEKIVIAVLGGILSGIGYGFVFKSGFTSGGTDILNQIMEKYMHIPIAKSILLIDGAITLLGGFFIGLSTLVYSIISLLCLSIFSNKTIIGVGDSKILYIYSTKFAEIKKYLHEDLKIDSTDFDCIGGYSNKKGKVILTVIHTKDYYRIKESIKCIDKNAFLTVTEAYQLVNENVTIRS